MTQHLLLYITFSMPFAARVARLSGWPDKHDGLGWNIFGGVALLAFGPFFWLAWWRDGQP